MTTVAEICRYLEEVAPLRGTEEWDNTGLLVGSADAGVERAMTCLTFTSDCLEEALAGGVQMVVTHHPIPFRPLRRLTAETTTGDILLRAIAGGIAIYSPHTSLDSAARGINRQIAEGLGLTRIEPLRPGVEFGDQEGGGRIGDLQPPLDGRQLLDRIKSFFGIEGLQVVGSTDRPVSRLGLACGSAGEFLEPAIAAGADGFLTGESNFHTCLEARSRGILMFLVGHFASERFALDCLAADLGRRFPELDVWASRRESDPLDWG